jgi:transcriptional regulator with XRE-family HTH domain
MQQINIDYCCNVIQLYWMKTNNLMEEENACVIFGEFIRSNRIARNLSARDVASGAEMLPSNFSKMEHGVLRPPQDGVKQKRIASALGLNPGSEEEGRFFDLAAKANHSTPADVADIISREDTLPLLLRTIGNKRLGRKEIEELVALVRDTDDDSKTL